MNKKIALPTLFLALASFALLIMHNPFQAKAQYEPFHVHGQLSQSTKNIFAKLHEKISTLEEANRFAQENLLRTGEYWDKQEDKHVRQLMEKNREEIINQLRELGMINEILPEKQHYTFAGLAGGLKKTVRSRINYLEELINNGYTFKYVVLLGGSRPLQENEKEHLPEDIKTEADMMVYLFNNSSIKNNKMILVDAPMVQKADGTWVRPNTDNTLVYFAKIAPEDGSFLMISDNPYVLRQTKVAQRILDQKRFPVDGAGKEANLKERPIIMICDEFARTLYEEFKQFTAQA